MNRIPFVRSAVVQPFVSFLHEVGAPVGRYLEEAKLSADQLMDPEGLVPTLFALRFAENAARRSGIDDLGIRVGSRIDPLGLGTFGKALASSGTVGRALLLSTAIRHSWNSGEHAWTTRRTDFIELHHRYRLGSGESWHQAIATNLIVHLNLLHRVGSPRSFLESVALPVRPSRAYAEIPELAGVRIAFDQPHTIITLRRCVLELPLGATSDARRSSALPPALPTSLTRSVEAFIAPLLSVRQPRIDLVAEAMGMNARTLQRRLAEAGASFGDIVSATRLRAARARLEMSEEKVVDIAMSLGYADAAHFTRAFKRWTGLAPVAYRAAQVGTTEARRAS